MDLRRHVPFLGSADRTRFCFLRIPDLEKALENPRVLDALIKQLEVPGKPGVLRAMSEREKLAAIEHQIETYRRAPTSVWRDVNPAEVLAASIFRATLSGNLPMKIGSEMWRSVKTEAALAAPVARWLKGYKLKTYSEVPLGTKRADVLAYREGSLLSLTETLCVVVELKNEYEQLKRGLDQMTTFAQYGHETYLACTPYFAAEYLDRHSEGAKVKHWDPNVLHEKVKAFGFGLLVVEGDEVCEVIKPERRTPSESKLEQVRFALKSAREI